MYFEREKIATIYFNLGLIINRGGLFQGSRDFELNLMFEKKIKKKIPSLTPLKNPRSII